MEGQYIIKNLVLLSAGLVIWSKKYFDSCIVCVFQAGLLSTDKNSNMMKKTLYLIVLLFLTSKSEAQTIKASDRSTLISKSGHYEELSAINPSPQSKSELDKKTFPAQEWDFMRNYLLLRTNYINVSAEKFKLKAFPANSSAQPHAELDYMLELQKNRTREQESWALELADVYYEPFTNLDPNHPRYQHNINCVFRIGSVLGDWYTPENLPATKKLFVNAIHDATYYFFYFKNHFNRLRPYQLEKQLKPLLEVGHPSYPGGHSSASYVNAYILSEIFPEKSEQF